MGTSTLAQATIIPYDTWEAFTAATTNTTTITFNDSIVSIKPTPTVSMGDVTFSSDRLSVYNGGYSKDPITTNYLFHDYGDENLVTITFSKPVFGFALDFGAIWNFNLSDPVDWTETFSFAGASQDFELAETIGYNTGNKLSFVGFTSGTSFDQIVINDPTMCLAIDNFYYTTNPASSVPVPAAIWFLGSGLLGLLGVRRKFPK